MEKCAFCKTEETQLYKSGVPLYIQCVEAREDGQKPSMTAQQIRVKLVGYIVDSTARVSAANESFSVIMGQSPSGLPYPDGAQRIHNASRELSVAREEMMKAHTWLNDFVDRGIVPDDLNREE